MSVVCIGLGCGEFRPQIVGPNPLIPPTDYIVKVLFIIIPQQKC